MFEVWDYMNGSCAFWFFNPIVDILEVKLPFQCSVLPSYTLSVCSSLS